MAARPPFHREDSSFAVQRQQQPAVFDDHDRDSRRLSAGTIDLDAAVPASPLPVYAGSEISLSVLFRDRDVEKSAASSTLVDESASDAPDRPEFASLLVELAFCLAVSMSQVLVVSAF